MMSASELVAVARGDKPADLVLRNCTIVNVFSGVMEPGDIAIYDGKIAGIGEGYDGLEIRDVRHAYVVPGLIDAHVHIESSLCIPPQFAAALVPRGVTTAIVDPHEVANVAGVPGIEYMATSSRDLPLDVVFMAPSSVPATSIQSSGSRISASALVELLSQGVVHGLAEVMNYPNVVNGDAQVLEKIAAFAGRPIDGHAPGLSGRQLNAYAAAGIGSDHECTTVEEAREKLARGLYLLIREATNARNLHTLLPLITPANARRICFCTDDRIPNDLLEQGSIDYMIREAIAYGIRPVEAIRMATLNPAEWFQLSDRGAIAPGRRADLAVVEDLTKFKPTYVYSQGKLVGESGRHRVGIGNPAGLPDAVGGSVNIDWESVDFRVPAAGRRLRVIGSIEDQLVTEERIVDASINGDSAVASPDRDLLKMAVVERHHASGSMGVGFIHGMGLRNGAIAGTISHDHHNLVVIGADDVSMMAAAHKVADMGGGLVVTQGESVTAALPLPVAGLMSDRPIADVCDGYETILNAAANQGTQIHDPFMAMSFMALEVIPKLKLSHNGLVDVERFEIVDLFVD